MLAFSGPGVKLRVAFQFFPWLAEPSPPVAASTVSPWSRTLSWPVRGDAAWKGGKVLDGAGPGFALHVTRSCSALRLISKKKSTVQAKLAKLLICLVCVLIYTRLSSQSPWGVWQC